MKKVTKKVTVCALFALAAVLSVATGGSSEKDKEKKTKSGKVAATLTADALYRAYKANEVQADSKYKGKVLKVSGVVDGIGKDMLDKPYVSLKTSSPIMTVQCFFSKSHLKTLGNLKKGQELTVKGVCDGKLGNVMLRGCVIE